MKNVSKETLIRTAILLITLINTVLSIFGMNPLPFSETEVYQAISAVCTVAATIWAWWKNNSFTQPAIEGDKVKDALKLKAKEEKQRAKEEKQQAKAEEANENDDKEDATK